MSNPRAPLSGSFVLSWAQITVGGAVPVGPEALMVHRIWEWTGEPVRLQAEGERPKGEGATRVLAEATTLAESLLIRALDIESSATDRTGPEREAQVFTVSDGIRFWNVAILRLAGLPRPMLVFGGEAPPRDRRLVISEAPSPLTAAEPVDGRDRRGAVCFVPGTRIETEAGPRPIETLAPGDRVVTRDDGAQEVLWIGAKRISGARLHACPDLRPMRVREGALGEGRPDGDLIVSPDHRLLLSGARARAAWGEPEVLVSARSLLDDHRVVRAHDLREVTYIHLLLPSHQIIWANGTPAESFHPADADLEMVPEAQRARLLDILPDAARDPEAYGPRARRVLGALEAAALIPRH